MPNPVTTAHLAGRWRPLTTSEATNAAALLDDAWSLLLAHRPTLEADLLAGTVLQGNVIAAVSAVVLRVLKNPDGYQSESLGSYSYQRAAPVAAGSLFITPEELSILTPLGFRQSRSVRLVAHGDP